MGVPEQFVLACVAAADEACLVVLCAASFGSLVLYQASR